MNCKTCGYRLWNIASRTCPECGSPFAPSDFEFAPNAVQFLCPDCQQVYYGTSPTGQLVPAEFDCVQCGRPLHMDEMVLRPADWQREGRTAADANPWLERRRRGRLGAFFATVGWGMGRPAQLIASTPVASPMNQAWTYLIHSAILYAVIGITPVVLFFAGIGMLASGSGGGIAVVMGVGLGTLIGVLLVPLMWVVFVLIWGAVAQLALIGTPHTAPIRRTYQALCYTFGPMCITAVPCLGYYLLLPFAGIWWVVSAILATREAHQTSGWRATVAIGLWPGIVTLTFAGLIVLSMFSVRQSMHIASAGGGQASSLAAAVIHHAAADPHGRGPAHAVELVHAQSWVNADMFVDWNSNTTLADVPLAGTDLDDFSSAAAAKQQALARQAVAGQPPDVIAHRLGDYVFTYHGIDLNQPPDPALWLVVYHPDPAVNPPPDPSDYCQVARADGSTAAFPFSQLSAELTQQNQQRAAANLPPLPDPAGVTHAQPAAAP